MLRSTLSRALVAGTLAIAAALGAASLSPAASGDLDTSYGSNGSRSIPTPVGTSTFTDSIRTSDGSIVAVGATGAVGARDSIIAKFTENGALDPTFGTGGVVTFEGGGTKESALVVTERPGGGYVVGGSEDITFLSVSDDGYVAKFNVNGVPDPAWGVGGLVTLVNFSTITGAVERANGEVLYAGSDNSFDLNVGSVDATGATSWTGFSQAEFFVSVNIAEFQTRMVRRSDGTYVLLSAVQRNDNTTEFATITFPETGPAAPTVYISNVPGVLRIGNAQIDVGDSLLINGSTGTTVAGTQRGALFRILANGTFDASFGTAGTMNLPAAAASWSAKTMKKLSDGSWWVVGDLGTDQVRSFHLTPSLTVDTSYGSSGTGIIDRSYGGATRATGLMIDAQKRPIVAGSIASKAATFRLEQFNKASSTLGAITSSPTLIQRYSSTTFKFTAANAGPDATDVVTDIDVPASFSGATYTSTNGGTTATVADGTGATWTLPQLPAGATATLTLVGKPSQVGTLTVGSSISSQSANRIGAAPASMSHSVTVFGAATPFDDVFNGTPFKDRIDALAGDDRVDALAGNDVLLGNLGNDVLFGNTGNDYVAGGPGNDAVYGGPGNDKVFGNAGNDRLYGGPGNDRIEGGPGTDYLQGDTGDDYLIANYGNETLVGGPGSDRLDGDGGNDRLYGNSGNDFINGKSGNDIAFGHEGNDWLRGYSGNDVLYGGTGRDLLNGGAGRDKLFGGPGFDIIRADDGAGGDIINCGTGWDLVYANRGDRVSSNCEFVKYDVPNGTPR